MYIGITIYNNTYKHYNVGDGKLTGQDFTIFRSCATMNVEVILMIKVLKKRELNYLLEVDGFDVKSHTFDELRTCGDLTMEQAEAFHEVLDNVKHSNTGYQSLIDNDSIDVMMGLSRIVLRKDTTAIPLFRRVFITGEGMTFLFSERIAAAKRKDGYFINQYKSKGVHTVRLENYLRSNCESGISRVSFTMREIGAKLELPKSYLRSFSEFKRHVLYVAKRELDEDVTIRDFGRDGANIWVEVQKAG